MFLNQIRTAQIKNAVLALSAAAFPGLQKLIIITLMIKLYGSNSVGQYATLTALPIFLTLLTGVGFGGKLLKLIPGEKELKQKQSFGDITLSSLIYVIIAGLLLYVLNLFEVIQNPLVMSFYLLSISCIQLIRHYYLATLNYVHLLFFDIVQLFILVLPVFFISDTESYVLISALALFCFCILWYVSVISTFKFEKSYFYDKETLQFSANNILSGGVLALMPLVLDSFYGKSVAGEVVVIINFFSLFLLLSRAFANYKIPVLVKLFKLKTTDFNIGASSFQKHYTALTIACLFLSLIVGSGAIYFKLTNILNISLINVFDLLSIVLFIFSGSFGVVQGVILFVLGQQKYNLYSNIGFFIVYFVVVGFAFLHGAFSLSEFFILSSIISFARLPYLFFYSKKTMNKTKESIC